MIKLNLQLFGGRGSGGGKGGAGAGGQVNRTSTGGQNVTARDPMTELEIQVTATERRIQDIRQRQKELEGQIPNLVRARNYDQIKLNNRESERLEKEIHNLENELSNLHKRGRALSRD